MPKRISGEPTHWLSALCEGLTMHLGIPTWLNGLLNDTQPPQATVSHPATMTSPLQQTRTHLEDLYLDDVAKKLNIGRAAMSIGYGLPPQDFTRPFPGSSTTVNMNQSGGGLAKLLGPLLMVAAGTGLGGGLVAALLNRPAANPVAPATPPAAQADAGARVHIYWDDVEIKPGQGAQADVTKGK